MAQVIVCSSGQTRYQVKDELAGKRFKCKKCGQVLQAPGVAPVAKAAGPAAAPTQPAAAPAQPMAAQKKPAPPQAKPAAPQAKPAAPQAKPTAPAGKPAPVASRAAAVNSLLDEALAATPPAGAVADLVEAVEVAEAPPDAGGTPGSRRAKKKCPHCGAKVDADVVYCTECGLSVHKKYSGIDHTEDRSDSKSWLYVLAGIGGAMLATPLLFLLVAVMAGGGFALFVCVIEMYLIIAIGSFALACRIFKQEPPEPTDILRIVGWSALPANMVVSYFGGIGPLSLLAAVGIAIVISSLVCMLHVQMPVFPSIFVSICYNVFAGILTVVGVLVLVVIFAGYLVTTSGTGAPREGQETEQMDPFAVPDSPAAPKAPGGPKAPADDDETWLDKPRDVTGPRWMLVREDDRGWTDSLARATSGRRAA
jgi:hypothetical protein